MCNYSQKCGTVSDLWCECFLYFFSWGGKILCVLILCLQCTLLKRKAATRWSSVLYTMIWYIPSKAKLLQPQSLISAVWMRWKSMGFFSFPERNAEFPGYLQCYYLERQQWDTYSKTSIGFHEWMSHVFCLPAGNSSAVKYDKWDPHSCKTL